MERVFINMKRDLKLKEVRKRGRPYQVSKHFSRDIITEMRENEIKRIQKEIKIN